MIDLRSDTVTRPTPGMRRAIAEAEVADDVLDGDPTVRRLEERTAELLGKPAGLFFPTGTMANQAGIWALAEHGTEILVHEDSHIVNMELGAAASLCGVQSGFIRGAPTVTLETLTAALRERHRGAIRQTLACFENTHNGAGGAVTGIGDLRAMATLARDHGMAVHLDGARLWNASAATGTPLSDFADVADVVMVSFSKGLGAPVGAVLAGSADVIETALEARRRFGGGMRQSGILAAAALYGIDHHLDRLGEDHEHARLLARLVADARHSSVVPPDTNIVMIGLPDRLTSAVVADLARAQGVLVLPWRGRRVRAVTHLDVTRTDVERAADVLRSILS